MVTQAELWLIETPNQKRRPVLVISRDEVRIGHDSVATFDNLAAVPKSVLTTRLGALGIAGRRQICDALAAMANC